MYGHCTKAKTTSPKNANKLAILCEYKQQFGANFNHSIVTKKKGETNKPTTDFSDRKCMRASLDLYYRVDEVTLYNVITMVLREHGSSLTLRDTLHLRLLNKDFNEMIPKTIHWLSVDFSALRAPRHNYESQLFIDPHHIEMANAAMIHFGLNPGKFIRWLGGEYTGQAQDVKHVLEKAAPYICPKDLVHKCRILLDGCLAEFHFTEPLSNKVAMIRRGNSKSIE